MCHARESNKVDGRSVYTVRRIELIEIVSGSISFIFKANTKGERGNQNSI